MKALFVCVENAGRSQMAEAFARAYGKDKVEAMSANQMVQEADVIIVMGCSAEGFCPAPLLNKVLDWGIEDPKGKPIEKVREIRDKIERKVRLLLDETV
jgi:protein-tyrosine-phosphatase